MLHKVLLILAILLIGIDSIAQLGLKEKNCLQMGYSIEGEYCMFPDGSRCRLEKFNSGECGQKFFKEQDCIKEGLPLFGDDICCDELIPYEKINYKGAATCQTKGKVYVNNLLGNDIFWLVSILVLIIIWFIVRSRSQ